MPPPPAPGRGRCRARPGAPGPPNRCGTAQKHHSRTPGQPSGPDSFRPATPRAHVRHSPCRLRPLGAGALCVTDPDDPSLKHLHDVRNSQIKALPVPQRRGATEPAASMGGSDPPRPLAAVPSPAAAWRRCLRQVPPAPLLFKESFLRANATSAVAVGELSVPPRTVLGGGGCLNLTLHPL